MSVPHRRRLGKLFVSGQPRETSPPSQQWQGRGAGREVVSPYTALTWGEDYPANALGNPFAPMSGAASLVPPSAGATDLWDPLAGAGWGRRPGARRWARCSCRRRDRGTTLPTRAGWAGRRERNFALCSLLSAPCARMRYALVSLLPTPYPLFPASCC